MKILSIDVGDVRVGLAISDALGMFATPLEILDANNAVEEILKIVKEKKVTKIIYGLPVSLDGTLKIQAEKVNNFILLLKDKTDVECIPIDERYTSKMAKGVFVNNNKNKNGSVDKKLNMNKKLDSIAASIILQSYLDSMKHKKI